MSLQTLFPDDWIEVLGEDALGKQLTSISNELVELRQTQTVLPEVGNELLFQAFRETPFKKVRVVVLGQDPYHDGSFNGLAFGNGYLGEFKDSKLSPSLKRILTEVERTESTNPNPNLYSWAYQGVLLINTAHTVVEGIPGSHLDLWFPFTKMVVSALNTKKDLIWLLWGSKAHAYSELITNPSHKLLKAGHPSPLNNTHPFAGCNCFQDCNLFLKSKGYEQILWN